MTIISLMRQGSGAYEGSYEGSYEGASLVIRHHDAALWLGNAARYRAMLIIVQLYTCTYVVWRMRL